MMAQMQRQTLLAVGLMLELLSLTALFAFGGPQTPALIGYMLAALVPIGLAWRGRLRLSALLTSWLLMASILLIVEPWTIGGRRALLENSYSAFLVLPLLLSSFLESTAHLLTMAGLLEMFLAFLIVQNHTTSAEPRWDTNILFIVPIVTFVAWRAAVIYRAGIESVQAGALAETRLIHAEAAREIAAAARQAAEGIAHDVVAPLGPISGILTFIQEDLHKNDIPRALEALAVVQSSLDALAEEGRSHLLEMRGLLTSASLPLGQIVERVLRRLPRSSLTIVSDHLAVAAHPALPPALLSRALQNALENALAFARSQVRITCVDGGDQISVAIEDDGPGIDQAVLAAGIQPGLSRRAGGSGLGLAGVTASLRAYNGTIRLENATSGGQISGGRTLITLPAHTQPSVAGDR